MTPDDWVVTIVLEVQGETGPDWELQIPEQYREKHDVAVAHIPGWGTHLTLHDLGDLSVSNVILHAVSIVEMLSLGTITSTYAMRESEYCRRADEPTMPNVMCLTDIAEFLGITRQRVDQLRKTGNFPTPVTVIGRSPVWDAAAIRGFQRGWNRKVGRPKSEMSESSA